MSDEQMNNGPRSTTQAALVIDDRETLLWDILQTKRSLGRTVPLVVSKGRLLVGDARLDLPGFPDPLVVERKRADDLVASVTDGRLAKQWHTAGRSALLYLVVIEEMGTIAKSRVARRARYSQGHRHPQAEDMYMRTWLQLSIETTGPRDAGQRLVVRTASGEETADVILLCGELLMKRISDRSYVPTCLQTDRLALPILPKGTSVFLRQLCCQPGVSLTRAESIARLLPVDKQNMSTLCNFLSSPEGEARLVACVGRSLGGRLLAMLLDGYSSQPPTACNVKRPRTVGKKDVIIKSSSQEKKAKGEDQAAEGPQHQQE